MSAPCTLSPLHYILKPSFNSMLLAVTPDEQERYTEIIDDILATADLETISRKKVRQALEGRLGGKDLSEQKVRVDHECLLLQYARAGGVVWV